MERGYKLEELYNMTILELRKSLNAHNKGLSYKMYKQAYLIGLAFNGKFPESPEKANKELYPPKKSYNMPDWLRRRYLKQKGVTNIER